jgi:hypothetical protein
MQGLQEGVERCDRVSRVQRVLVQCKETRRVIDCLAIGTGEV